MSDLDRTERSFADGVVIGDVTPKPGDRIRVTRTEVRTTVYEGFLQPASGVSLDGSWVGLSVISPRPDMWMRLRDQGPRAWSDDTESLHESDTIELLEARDGAPYDDIVNAAVDDKRARDESEEKRQRTERLVRTRAKRRDKIARLFGRRKETKS